MVLNIIWILLFLISFVIILFKMLFLHDATVMPATVNAITESSKTAFELCLGLTGAMCFWLGIMRIGEKGGAITIFSRLITPFFSRLFPDIPKDHPAMGSILMNYSANMLGLDNAATPFGLKAMKELQEINPEKETASNAMIMFLTLNTAGFTIIPVSIIAFRASAHAANPTDIFIPLLIATYGGMISGLILCTIIQKIKWDFVLTSWIAGMIAFVGGLTYLFSHMDKARMEMVSNNLGGLIIFSIIISFISLAFYKKVDVYDAFIDGAKEGFDVAVKIIPYLVAMLVAIAIFRAS